MVLAGVTIHGTQDGAGAAATVDIGVMDIGAAATGVVVMVADTGVTTDHVT
ncbi:hypothetical protein D3C72_2289380 [compost metagenome]